MIAPPAPLLVEHEGVIVLRDDIVLGGTKARVLPPLLAGEEEWVYAGPGQGYAQVALGLASALGGCRTTLFTPERRELLPLTELAMALGLRVVAVQAGRLGVLKARAREYCDYTGATLLPLGLELPGMEEGVAELARSLPVDPAEVWVAAGSGLLARGLAAAWPAAQLHAVRVGKEPRLPEGAQVWRAPEPFDKPAAGPLPPFPSVRGYDAKAWRFVAEHARRDGRALYWNVAAEAPSAEQALALLAKESLDLRLCEG